MKKTAFYIGIFLFSTNLSFSQKTDKIKELKSFALSVCIQDNYRKLNPEFDSKDYTNSFIVGDIVTISTSNLEKLRYFIYDNTKDFYKPIPSSASYEDNNANMVCYNCIEFYNSKKLRKFIKNLL
ncbi:hypothetical protein ETU10_02600 [Apibacter muscae]|uniref:hypothetical protein n=1 Tax=Apibacter muscae TaxID=2509004 RepID=UPI0011AC7611|nr:hypothetical protein [Apibacter muscae]TWP24870.1 hypothetical protein ETU10_02600 [Apibacter muscae]